MQDMKDCKCPSCGAVLVFSPTEQRLKCPYCGTVRNMYDPEAGNEDLGKKVNAEPKSESGTEGYVYSCRSCGGRIVAGETVAATRCPYCGNTAMFLSKLSGKLKPEIIVPFSVEKKTAREKLEGFVKRRHFVPKDFRKSQDVENIKGIYVPVWLCDASIEGSAEFRADKISKYREGDCEVTETKHYRLLRGGRMSFENVPADGSRSLPDKILQSLETYDVSNAQPFKTGYLSGFLADCYDEEASGCAPRAHERMNKTLERKLSGTVFGYDRVMKTSYSGKVGFHSERYAFLPVWLMNVRYDSEPYLFAVNGQNGKMSGEIPFNAKSFWLWLVSLSLLCSAACWGVFTFRTEPLYILLSLLIGTGLSLAGCLLLKGRLNTLKEVKTAEKYVCPDSFSMTCSDDIYLYSDYSRVKIEDPSKTGQKF